VGVLILLNTVVIALQAFYIRQESVWEVLERVEFIFLFLFALELTWRVADDGAREFFMGQRCQWNVFDFVCVAVGVLDCLRCEIFDDRPSGAWVARMFRVLRIMRMLRMLRFVNEIDYVIVTTVRAALSLAILIGLMIFMFAVYSTNILWDAPDEQVADNFGNLTGAIWSLFKVMTMDGWIATAETVMKVNPRMGVFFVLFVFCTSLALMALVPAILIEVNTRYREREKQSRENKRCRARLCKEEAVLRHIFAQVAATELPSPDQKVPDDFYPDSPKAIRVSSVSSIISTSPGTSRGATVRIVEMYRAISDRETAQLLLHDLDEESHRDVRHVFRDVRLGLFDLWQRQIEENGDPDEGMTEAEFLERVLQPRDAAEQALWRTTTATRMHLHELDAAVRRHASRTDHLQEHMQEVVLTTQAEISQIHTAIKALQAASLAPGSAAAPPAASPAATPPPPLAGSCGDAAVFSRARGFPVPPRARPLESAVMGRNVAAAPAFGGPVGATVRTHSAPR
jgi:voltage-gated sodium channel